MIKLKYTFRQSSLPRFGLDAYIGFGSYNEESTYAVYRIQVAKIVVTTVKYIMRTTFIRNHRHRFCIVNISRSNMHKCRNFRFHIVERMHLDSAFMLAEFSPLEH